MENRKPEGPEMMREAAEFVVDYCQSRGIAVHHTAIEVFEELGEELPEADSSNQLLNLIRRGWQALKNCGGHINRGG